MSLRGGQSPTKQSPVSWFAAINGCFLLRGDCFGRRTAAPSQRHRGKDGARMEVKAGYKKTEVGIIPDDWQVVTLAKVCKMKSGESITSAGIDQFSEYPCYGGNGLRGFTSQFTHDGEYALIGRQGALCGNVLGVSGKFFASEHAVVVTPF